MKLRRAEMLNAELVGKCLHLWVKHDDGIAYAAVQLTEVEWREGTAGTRSVDVRLEGALYDEQWAKQDGGQDAPFPEQLRREG